MRPPPSTSRCSARVFGPWARPSPSRSLMDMPFSAPPPQRPDGATRWSGNYETKDERVHLALLPPGRPVLAGDVRGDRAGPSWSPTRASPTTTSLIEHGARGQRDPRRGIRQHTLEEWRRSWPASRVSGRSSRTPSRRRSDPQTRRQRLRPGVPHQVGRSVPLVAAPVQYGEEPATPHVAHRSSTSTATRYSPKSASTGMPPSTSRSAGVVG